MYTSFDNPVYNELYGGSYKSHAIRKWSNICEIQLMGGLLKECKTIFDHGLLKCQLMYEEECWFEVMIYSIWSNDFLTNNNNKNKFYNIGWEY